MKNIIYIYIYNSWHLKNVGTDFFGFYCMFSGPTGSVVPYTSFDSSQLLYVQYT